jgi:hypothetical protein
MPCSFAYNSTQLVVHPVYPCTSVSCMVVCLAVRGVGEVRILFVLLQIAGNNATLTEPEYHYF